MNDLGFSLVLVSLLKIFAVAYARSHLIKSRGYIMAAALKAEARTGPKVARATLYLDGSGGTTTGAALTFAATISASNFNAFLRSLDDFDRCVSRRPPVAPMARIGRIAWTPWIINVEIRVIYRIYYALSETDRF